MWATGWSIRCAWSCFWLFCEVVEGAGFDYWFCHFDGPDTISGVCDCFKPLDVVYRPVSPLRQAGGKMASRCVNLSALWSPFIGSARPVFWTYVSKSSGVERLAEASTNAGLALCCLQPHPKLGEAKHEVRNFFRTCQSDRPKVRENTDEKNPAASGGASSRTPVQGLVYGRVRHAHGLQCERWGSVVPRLGTR